jgi:signal transduction histidine kinase
VLRRGTLGVDARSRPVAAGAPDVGRALLSGAEGRGLTEEQAALRRVTTLVARGVPDEQLFAAVTEEVGHLLRVEYVLMGRYEPDGALTVVSSWGAASGDVPVGRRHTLGGRNLATTVFETGRFARIDNYAAVSGPFGVGARHTGIRSAVATPITVAGRLWGIVCAGSRTEQPLPAHTEARIASFTELVATAIATADNRVALARLVEEQAALRRVATLVALGTRPEDVFRAVNEEVARLLPVTSAAMGRYEPDGTCSTVAAWSAAGGHAFPVGDRWDCRGNHVTGIVLRTGRPARLDDFTYASGPIGIHARAAGYRSAVGSPIEVEGRLWGVMSAASNAVEPLPAETEARLASFTELVATAIANAESRVALARLAEEQAALRRVATLVARGVPPQQVYAAVTEEVVRLLPVDFAHMGRYEPDAVVTVLAASGSTAEHFPVGRVWSLGGKNVATIVFETGRPGRLDHYGDAHGVVGLTGRELGMRSSAGTPIIVEGKVWGVVVAGSTARQSLSPGIEGRLGSFTELVATAVANSESRAALAASRARIVAAADESRRRIERDLHDGAQQRLAHAVIVQKLALQALSNGDANAGELVAEGLRYTEQANAELRELAHGILPAALIRGGLRAGVEALVSRVPLPVSVDVPGERLPAGVEATAYFVVSEALTNVVKHARAAGARVTARVERGELHVEVGDDGVGGARGGHGTGLGGLEDRVSALDGRLVLESPPSGGTRVCALLPVPTGR